MKKIIFTLSLTIILILSGCFPFVQGFYNAVPNTEISKSLISKMQSNIDTHSLEGFTAQSTFADVLAKTDVKKISHANLAYRSELLGYPAVMECIFDYYGGDKLLLDYMCFDIIPGSQENGFENTGELLTKLNSKLGSYKEKSEDDGVTEYIWEKDGWQVDISFYDDDYEPNNPSISVRPQAVIMGNLPKIPDIFPYQFGTDVNTVYQNETPVSLPEGFEDDCCLVYEDKGMEIHLQFETKEIGIKLSEGRYDVYLNDMDFEDSLDYFESLADGLETKIGAPLSRGYGIPDVDEDSTGISGMTYEIGTGGQGLSAQDILNSGKKYYWLDINWPGISFDADYGMGVSMNVDFSKEYFSGAASE